MAEAEFRLVVCACEILAVLVALGKVVEEKNRRLKRKGAEMEAILIFELVFLCILLCVIRRLRRRSRRLDAKWAKSRVRIGTAPELVASNICEGKDCKGLHSTTALYGWIYREQPVPWVYWSFCAHCAALAKAWLEEMPDGSRQEKQIKPYGIRALPEPPHPDTPDDEVSPELAAAREQARMATADRVAMERSLMQQIGDLVVPDDRDKEKGKETEWARKTTT